MAETKINASQTTITASDIGAARATTVLPTASASEAGKIYQFVGTTDANYTNGYFYKCVSDGAVTPTYSWTQVNVQPQGDSLPSQSGKSGKFLTTDGTDASWSTTVDENVFDIKNTASGLYSDQLQMRLYAPYNNTDGTPVEIYANHSGMCTISGIVLGLGNIRTTSLGKDIGTLGYPFRRIYVNNIYNGADIAVPAVAGSIAVQVSTIPTAASTLEGQIYQFIGATDSTYTNGRFYKCVSDGQATPTYSWEEVSIGGGGSSYTAGNGISITNNEIAVADPVLVNNPTGTSSVNIKGSDNNKSNSVAIGSGASVTNNQGIAIGWDSQAGYDCTAVGAGSVAYDDYSTAIGFGARVPYSVACAIQLGNGTNNTSGTMAVALSTNGSSWTNYELLSSNGTIPEARLADTTNAAQGQVLTLDSNLNAVWQAGSGGLPSQTGQSGKFLTTDGTDASWSDKPLVNKSTNNTSYVVSAITGGTILASSNTTIFGYTTGTNVSCSGSVVGFGTELGLGTVDNVAVGHQAYLQPNAKYSVVVGKGTATGGTWNLGHKYLVAVGCGARIGEYGITTTAIIGAMQFGKGTNLESGTVCFGLTTDGTNFNNYKLLDSDGTIPTARLTKVDTTITLTAAGWSSNTQTVNVTGMTATGVVLVSPAPASAADYASAGILCTAQAAGTLTFTCDTVPSGDIDVNVVML